MATENTLATEKSIEICLLSPSSAPLHISTLVKLINTAYSNEQALWNIPNKPRTSISEVTSILGLAEFIGAFSPTTLQLVGCVQVHPLSFPKLAGLGMLAVSDSARGQGLGRRLVEAAETKARDDGFEEIQLELFMPKDWKLEPKEILKAWYKKLGYSVVEEAEVVDYYPALVPLLACKAKLVVFKKRL